MTRLFFFLLVLVSGCSTSTVHQAQPRSLHTVNALPLAIDPAFSFRKNSIFLHDRSLNLTTSNQMINFERERIGYGAISEAEKAAREGHYFRFWWRTKRSAHVTVRLEYRQAKLGAAVQVQEVEVEASQRGTFQTNFKVIGDRYHKDGRVTDWRALIIENGKIVAQKQSFLWN